MSFSYTDDLSASKDKVRFLTGDTSTTYAMFTDEEVNAMLAKHSDNWYKAAGQLLQMAAASPGTMLLVHDASGRVFVMSRLASMFSAFADRWVGEG